MMASAEEPARGRAEPPPRLEPRTIDYSDVSLDILGDLLSFHARTVGLALNKSYDHAIGEVSLAHGTGKVSVLLLTAANPGIRPSVIAHFIHKDRAAMARLVEQMKEHGLIEHQIDAEERRAHELYLTPKGESLLQRVRAIAIGHSDRFFGVLTSTEQRELLRLLMKLYEAHVAPLPTTVQRP
ncbi:MAG: MarR family winged helix-turn-helix transcriptional regulator [Geminicoccaceae bacterium]